MTDNFVPKECKLRHAALLGVFETVHLTYMDPVHNVDNIFHLTANNDPSCEARSHS